MLKAIEVAMRNGAINNSAVENILRQQEVQKPIFNEKGLKKELKSTHIFSWKFDLTPYAKLCEEALS